MDFYQKVPTHDFCIQYSVLAWFSRFGGFQNMEKTAKKVSWKSWFFEGVEKCSWIRFLKFWLPFWSSRAIKNRKNQAQFMLLCPEGPLDRFGISLGSVLDKCWCHFDFFFSQMFSDVSDFFERCSGLVCFHWLALLLSPKTCWRTKENKGKDKEKEIFVNRSLFQLALITCVREAKRVGSFLFVLLVWFRLLAFAYLLCWLRLLCLL